MSACKRFLALFFSLLICLSAASTGASAMILGGSPSSGDGTLTIIGVGNPDPLATRLLFLDPAAYSAEDTAAQLPSTEPCLIDGFRRSYFCPVSWDLSLLDPGKPGRQFISGTLEPAEGYVFGEGVSSTVSYPVYFTGGSTADEALTELYSEALPTSYMALLPVNGDPSTLELQQFTAQCLTEEGSFTCPLTWDFSAVDVSKPGVYTATAAASLPAGFVPPADGAPLTAAVGVVDPTYPDLSAYHITDYGNLECDFLYTISDLSPVRVEVSQDDGPWTADDTAVLDAGRLRGTYFELSGISFLVYLTDLTPQVSYRFRILYEDGKQSNVLTIRLEEKAGLLQPVVAVGGNRDGSENDSLPDLEQPAPDTGGSAEPSAPSDSSGSSGSQPAVSQPAETQPAETPSTETQPAETPSAETPSAETVPAPESEAETAAEPQRAPSEDSAAAQKIPAAPVRITSKAASDTAAQSSDASETEIVTDTYTVLSGLRMRRMVQLGGDTVLFEKQGVSVELSSVFLSSLPLGDEELLKVAIDQPAENSFRLAITAAGDAITRLSATSVQLRWSGQTENLECVDSKDVHVSAALYHKDTRTVSCTVYAPGTYSIRPVPAASEAPTPLAATTADADASDAARSALPARLMIALPAAVIGATAVIVLLRRRHE